ncbi:hypothetical protein PM082_003856 [Marasmius tenuissimus]|nr:hypothetical protein PM082_003856 [Marasmius tenuissimus]
MTLVNKHHILPFSLFVHEVVKEGPSDLAMACGGFADIFKGTYRDKPVCLKVLRIYLEAGQHEKDKLAEEFYKEALLWTQLTHPNLLPFHGVSTSLFPQCFCLVSPWMDNGDIITFLRHNPDHDRLTAILEISAGMAYLHEQKVVHADIKGANVLVDERGSCRLADFGLARMVTETMNLARTNTHDHKGSLRWMAPELFHLGDGATTLNADGEGQIRNDRFTRDIYAFACTVLEIITGKPPFADIVDPTVMFQVTILKARPPRPSSEFWCPDVIWAMVRDCWAQQVKDRPKASEVHGFLLRLVDLRHNNSEFPWEDEFLWGPLTR